MSSRASPGTPLRRRESGAARRRPLPAAARRSKGFTLLETMVALVVFAAAAMALYGLLNSNLIALARAHDVARQAPAAAQRDRAPLVDQPPRGG